MTLTLFIKLIIDQELQALKTLEVKFWLKFIIFRIFAAKYMYLIESFLMCSFVYLGFLKRLLRP